MGKRVIEEEAVIVHIVGCISIIVVWIIICISVIIVVIIVYISITRGGRKR